MQCKCWITSLLKYSSCALYVTRLSLHFRIVVWTQPPLYNSYPDGSYDNNINATESINNKQSWLRMKKRPKRILTWRWLRWILGKVWRRTRTWTWNVTYEPTVNWPGRINLTRISKIKLGAKFNGFKWSHAKIPYFVFSGKAWYFPHSFCN